jgi:hypothetical protein
MNSNLLRLILGVVLAATTATVSAQASKKGAAPSDDPVQAALQAAEDERVAALLAPEPKRLNAIFSDALRYTHSNGDFDTKSTYIGKLVSGSTKYTSYQSTDRKFTVIAPGIALMNGRVRVIGRSDTTPDLNLYLSVLVVFREEQGKWRFLAWQSARLPLPEPAAGKK